MDNMLPHIDECAHCSVISDNEESPGEPREVEVLLTERQKCTSEEEVTEDVTWPKTRQYLTCWLDSYAQL